MCHSPTADEFHYSRRMKPDLPELPWLAAGEDFPHSSQAWGNDSPAPGLLAGGGSLDVDALYRAYRGGIFPWFSLSDPILWWSPDPRMVLDTGRFKVHPSFRKTLRKFRTDPRSEVRFDTAFEQVIQACSASPRRGQSGTWIVPDMVHAYVDFHRAGWAHSVETWVRDELVGGLYLVAIGKAVFGESMFSRARDASKVALAALVAFCRSHDMPMIDCQQNTRHLASMGAAEISRTDFLAKVSQAVLAPAPRWHFEPVYWDALTPPYTEPA